MDILKRYNMQHSITWISFSHATLIQILTADPYARIGYNYASMEISTYAVRKQLIDETYFPTSWEDYTLTWTVPIESANPNGGVTIRW